MSPRSSHATRSLIRNQWNAGRPIGLALCSLFLFGSLTESKDLPPNIVFFLVDDLGWTDINCREGLDSQRFDNPGGDHDSRYYYTPRIATLRNEGMRFTNAYAACPFCGPSRASILTGKYPARIGFTNNNTHDQKQGRGPFALDEMIFTEPTEPELVRNLDPSKETSLAKALKAGNGYLSCSIGKWHVYSEGSEGYSPEHHGFDYNVGGGYRGQPAGGDRPGWDFYRGTGWSEEYFPNLETANEIYAPNWPTKSNGDAFENLGYLTEALTFRALEFIDLASKQSQPFFLYLSHYGVHSPLQAKRRDSDGDGTITPSDAEVHASLFKDRWGRDARHSINPPKGSESFHTRYTYASMVKSIDESLGQIMDRLDSTGLAENTVVFFYSDNGGVERNGFTSNNPLRSEKTHGYEGGTRVPLIVRGPGIAANSVCDTPVTGPDFFPTMLELAGTRLSDVERASTNGFSQIQIDGVSIVPLLQGNPSDLHRENDPRTTNDDGAIFWHVPHYKHSAPYSAVLQSNRKYIRYWEDETNLKNRRETEDGYYMSENELYDLTANPGESGSRNLFESDQATAQRLEAVLFQWLANVNASLPTAVKRENENGATRNWYSRWIADQDASQNYADPIRQAIEDATDGDVITVFPRKPSEPLNFSETKKGVRIDTIPAIASD